MSTTFNGQMVGFMLKERLGWDSPDVFPSAVEIEHDCDRDNPYVVDGNVFYDRKAVRYVPERTCRVIDHELSCDDCQCEKWVLSCGHEVITESNDCPPRYCDECGAKVVDE